MDYDVASAELFNSLPETPAVVTEFFDAKSDLVIPVPLHRHQTLKEGGLIVWEYSGDRLVAKPTAIADTNEVFPVSWFKSAENALIAYEFATRDTIATFGEPPSHYLSGVFSSLEDPRLPNGFGVSALWPTYTSYLKRSKTISSEFLNSQEATVENLISEDDLHTFESRHLGSTRLFCEGIGIDGVDCRVNFIELNAEGASQMFAVSQEFMLKLKNRMPVEVIYAGGGCIKHQRR